MRILFFSILFVVTLIAFFIIDMLWLGFMARRFYQAQLAHLLNPRTNWSAAVVFYLVFVAGLIFFAVWPAVESGSFSRALLMGALYGFFTYATYDLTNLATLRDWPLALTIVDITWGVLLAGTVSSISYHAGRWLSNFV